MCYYYIKVMSGARLGDKHYKGYYTYEQLNISANRDILDYC